MPSRPSVAAAAALGLALAAPAAHAQAPAKKPNILVIFGDDVGQTNISAYSMGVVGYRTPNIDGIAKEGMLFNDDGMLVAVRFENFKIVFCEQRVPGGFEVWSNPFTCLRAPKIYNLRMDPFERADIVSDQYYDWLAQNAYVIQYTLYRVKPFLASLKEYPPSQRVGSFSIDQMMEVLEHSVSATTGGK